MACMGIRTSRPRPVADGVGPGAKPVPRARRDARGGLAHAPTHDNRGPAPSTGTGGARLSNAIPWLEDRGSPAWRPSRRLDLPEKKGISARLGAKSAEWGDAAGSLGLAD